MRPIRKRQSALRAPLNEILHSEAQVRLLRELGLVERGVTPGELAERADLDRAGAYRALDRLFRTGIVEYDDSAGSRQCRLREAHPLVQALEYLFLSESQRFAEIVATLRREVEGLVPPPISAWIEGSVARGTDHFGDPVVVGILDTPDHLDEHVEQLNERLVETQRDLDFTVEIRGRTRADLASLSSQAQTELARAIPLFGPPVEVFVTPEHYRSARNLGAHGALDDRSLAYGRAIADRLRVDPTLIERARGWIIARLPKVSEREAHELREWDRLLRSSTPARLSRFLTDPGERPTRLRQSNPFLPVLSAAERAELLRTANE